VGKYVVFCPVIQPCSENNAFCRAVCGITCSGIYVEWHLPTFPWVDPWLAGSELQLVAPTPDQARSFAGRLHLQASAQRPAEPGEGSYSPRTTIAEVSEHGTFTSVPAVIVGTLVDVRPAREASATAKDPELFDGNRIVELSLPYDIAAIPTRARLRMARFDEGTTR
jgi:hypothetical protein